MQTNNRKDYQTIPLPFKIKQPVLAVGSQTKNTVCFACGRRAHVSAVHSDLSDPHELSAFERTVRNFLKLKPRLIACDLHPDYVSTRSAHQIAGKAGKLKRIQHHYAHIAACMAENGLKSGRVIGVAFDGTGLGSDGTLWGAEFLACDYDDFQRVAHLAAIPLLGGEAAVREPWRTAAAWLDAAYGEKFTGLDIGFTQNLDKKKWAVLKKMYRSGLNSIPASSMGRLFDAAASILLEDNAAHHEAELAIRLEKLAKAHGSQSKPYRFNINKKDGVYIIDPLPLFRELVSDIKKHRPKEEIAYRFHQSIAEMIRKTCLKIRREHRIDRVALSGGVFQNNLLLCLCRDLLYKEGFNVLTHKQLSCNDSGVSLGQAVVAAHQ